MDTTIVHWNIRGYRGNYNFLRKLLTDTQSVVMCLQETRMPINIPQPPRGFTMYHSDGRRIGADLDHGGVCTLVKSNVGHVHLPLNTNLQAVAVRCHLDRLYTICNIYLPPNDPVTLDEITDLISLLPEPYILVGDFNARHTLWGDVTTNSKGRIIENILNNNDCSILNNNRPTHFHIQTDSLSCIDLSLCSSDVFPSFSWSVSNDLYNSDHFPVRLQIQDTSCRRTFPRFIFERADWRKFKDLAKCDAELASFDSVDQAVQYFNEVIITAADASISKTNDIVNTKIVPWWNPQLGDAHFKQKQALRKYQTSKLLIDKINFKKTRARFRYLMKNSKIESWKNYVSNINDNTPMKQIWKRVNKIRGKHSNIHRPILKDGNNLVTDPHEVGNIFGNNLREISRGSQSPAFLQIKRQSEKRPVVFQLDDNEEYNTPFSKEELNQALKVSKDSAPGEDGISYCMIKHLPQVSFLFLLSLFNLIWSSNVFPSMWRTAIVVPFPKPGKDPTDPSNYRPIALTSCLSKLLERMVNYRLVWHLESNNLLHPNQYGFRRGHSTVDVLARIDSYIKVAFAMKEHVVAVFFDLVKAYDTTWKGNIIQSLVELGFVGHLPRFIQNFLSNRFMKVKIGDTLSQEFHQYEGVPQGSVISCTLFALAVNNLPTCIPQYVESSLYVDDFAIFTRSASLPAAERRIQLAINGTLRWATERGFTFSHDDKTVCVHFSKIRKLFPQPELYLGPHRIKSKTETKFLGLTLDSKLSYIPHIKTLKGKCIKRMDLLKCLSRLSWGADGTCLLRLYRSLIRSKLDYACQIYSSATKTSLKMLDSVHHQAIRLCTGAFRTSPIHSLYAESGEPSLFYRRDELILRLYVRLLSMTNTPTHRTVSDSQYDRFFINDNKLHTTIGYRARKLLTDLEINNVNVTQAISFDVVPYTMKLEKQCDGITDTIKNTIPADNLKALFLDHYTSHLEDTTIFTDGSKSDNGVGCAAILPNSTVKHRLPEHSSIYTAELKAILIALTNIVQYSQQTFTIFSDSQSVLHGITDPFAKHPMITQIHTLLDALHKNNKTVSFCWVPSHVGIHRNEMADEAAKQSCSTELEPNQALPHYDYYPVFHRKISKQWKEEWNALQGNKLRIIKSDISVWQTSRRIIRKQETILTRLRIGHTRLTHIHLLRGEPPPLCEECYVPLTVNHILVECPEYADQRLAAFGSDGITTPVYLKDILANNESSIADLFSFLHLARITHDI